jgi:tRNA(Ile)-lysidine synthase
VIEVETRVREDGLLAPGRPVVVLLSAGRDSTALLHLATRIAGAAAVRALHVNYGLRDAADGDERACTALCAQLGVELVVERPRRPESPPGGPGAPGGPGGPGGPGVPGGPGAPGSPPAGNLQAWARDARYGAAVRLAQPRDADVASGHTATDQVETILYRLASSPSRRALLGMSPRDGALIRPLLALTREQTAAYCLEHGLQWVEDESNASPVFARNRIRARLLPALLEAHPAALENVLAVAGILRDESEVLDALVDETLGGRREIELARLRALPPALRRLVVQRLADGAAGGFAPGAARRADEVAALREAGVSALDLPGGVRAVARDGVLRFSRTPHAQARAAGRASRP